MKNWRGSLTAIRCKNWLKPAECLCPVHRILQDCTVMTLKRLTMQAIGLTSLTSLHKQAVLFSHPRQLEPSPLTTKTQDPLFFLLKIACIHNLLHSHSSPPNPFLAFFLYSHSSWVWGLAGRHKYWGPLFFFLSVFSLFLYFSGLAAFFFFFFN